LDAGEDADGDGNLDTALPGSFIGFSKNPVDPFSTGGGREGPFFEFRLDRVTPRFDPLAAYLDSYPGQTLPYLYFSSNDGRGYDPVVAGSHGSFLDVYREFSGVTPPPPGIGTGKSSTLPAQKSLSFQIISPGADFDYGLGGAFSAKGKNGALSSTADYDNITNFHSGRLFSR
jgi:hypothetical protein